MPTLGARHSLANSAIRGADLAMLHRSRLVIAGEPPRGRRFDEARLKHMVGGDEITARFMRQNNFTFRPQLKLLLAANRNSLPRLQAPDSDGAMRRRLHLIPFNHKPARIDPDLLDKLKAEAGGIMKWIAEGAVDWFKGGLRPPPVVVKETNDYFAANDTVERWGGERCERGPDVWGAIDHLYTDYRSWCAREGEAWVAKRAFSAMLAGWQGAEKRKRTTWGFVGIGLRTAQRALDLDVAAPAQSWRGEPARVPDWPNEPPTDDPAEDWPRD